MKETGSKTHTLPNHNFSLVDILKMSPTTLLCLATRSLRTTTQSVRVRPCQPRVYQLQPFSTTIPSPYPRKGAEDKDSINRESTEYTRSGTDDATANDPEAFDPSTTSPKSERDEGTKVSKDVENTHACFQNLFIFNY